MPKFSTFPTASFISFLILLPRSPTLSNISFLKKNLQLDGQNEDHILSISAYFHGMKVNGLEDGRKFSVETIYDEDTMACHQIHHYQTEENIRKIINKVRYD